MTESQTHSQGEAGGGSAFEELKADTKAFKGTTDIGLKQQTQSLQHQSTSNQNSGEPTHDMSNDTSSARAGNGN